MIIFDPKLPKFRRRTKSSRLILAYNKCVGGKSRTYIRPKFPPPFSSLLTIFDSKTIRNLEVGRESSRLILSYNKCVGGKSRTYIRVKFPPPLIYISELKHW